MTGRGPGYDPPRRGEHTRRFGDRHGRLVDAIFQNNWRGSVGPFVEFLGQSPNATAMLVAAAVQVIDAVADPNALAHVADAALAAERRARGNP